MMARRCWMLLATAIVAGSLLADPPRPLPPGMGQYILVLWDPGTPIPGDPHGRKMKPIPEPDIVGMGGQVIESRYNRRLIILPRGVAKQLARHKAVAYLQRVWMGEDLEEEEDFSGDLRSEPVPESDVDLTWGPHAYSYDGSGNITAVGPDSYTYDSAGRLIRATVKGKTETYKYDSFGNLVEKSGGTTVPIPVDPGSNRIIGVTYDEVGNITAQAPSAYLYAGGYTVPGVSSYSYDSLGMLTAYKRSWNAAIDFQMIYDASDERVGHMIATDTVRWTIRDFDGQVLREYMSGVWSGQTWEWTQDHIRGGGQLIAGEVQTWDYDGLFVWGGERHYHLDHLGSVRIVTDDQGRSLSENDYYPFGNNETKFFQQPPSMFNGHVDRMRFAGHMRDFYGDWDVENKEYLDYMHARYYDPNLGRFLSVDPGPVDAAYPQTWNRYSYALNNPLKYIDPTGEVVNLAGLSSQERSDLLLSLNAFTGNEYGVNNNGELTVINYGNGASSTATQFLDDAIGATNTYTVNAVNNSKYVNLMDANTTTGQIRVDFADFANTNMKGLPKEAFHLGENLFHELVHTHFKWTDPHEAGQGPTATDRLHINGPVVDFTNRVHAERGLPLRGPSYAPQNSSRTIGGRVRVPFIDPRTGRTVYVFPRLRP